MENSQIADWSSPKYISGVVNQLEREPSGSPLKVGLVGTGYAAQKRAEAFQADSRSELLYVAGSSPQRTAVFCESCGASPLDSWEQLVACPELDLIAICTINSEHGAIARAVLEAGKHAIVEYPLALSAEEGQELSALAQRQGKLLHVEHIELLGGLHQAVRQHLPQIGRPFYARYATLVGQRPAPRRWTYHQQRFGFPLIAALSRIHRLTDLFGQVESVSCQSRFWDAPESGYFSSCLSAAQLQFSQGLLGEIIYGKGEIIWQEHRTLELQGEAGALIFEGEVGKLIQGSEVVPVEVGSRRGLFARDTELVLDYLWENKPLYVNLEASLYALKVATAASQSAMTGNTIYNIA